MPFVQTILSCGCDHHFAGKIYPGSRLMGVTVNSYIKSSFFRRSLSLFLILPLLIWATGNFPERSLLKESLSLITILAFCQMMGQFFWARTSRLVQADIKMGRVVKYHKVIGYIFVAIMLFHPIYIIIPRFFEAGISPLDAFITIITTVRQGVVLGIIAWCLMLLLGVTSYFRESLPFKYKTWRMLHALMGIAFMVMAAWHVIDLGRHTNIAMAIYISVLAGSGIGLLLIKMFSKRSKNPTEA